MIQYFTDNVNCTLVQIYNDFDFKILWYPWQYSDLPEQDL